MASSESPKARYNAQHDFDRRPSPSPPPHGLGDATKVKCWGAEFGDAIIKHMTGGSTSVEPKSKPVMAGA
jgi:hypothetical protein